jgi:hypothetical protein
MVAAAALVAVATFAAQRQLGAVASLENISLDHRLLNALASVGIYLRTFLWPAELCIFYPLPDSPRWGAAAVGFFALAMGSLLAVLGARRSPLVTFGWVWFLGSLLPVIGIVQVGSQSHADRYMYVPMIGLLIAFGTWCSQAKFPGCRSPRLVWASFILAFATGMGGHAYAYTMSWRDPETAYRRSLDVAGVSYVMLANLSATLTNLNYYKTAEFYAEICVRIWPDRPLVIVNLASVKGLLNKLDSAEAGFRRAMVLEPDNVKHPYMLSLVLLQTGRNQEAEAVLNDALRLLPSETDWRKGHQMIRRILLRQEPLPQFPVAGLLTPDSTNSATQRGSK